MYAAAPSCFAAVCGWTIMELRLENGQFTQTCICDIMIGKQYPVCFRRVLAGNRQNAAADGFEDTGIPRMYERGKKQ